MAVIRPIQEKAMIEELLKRLDHPTPWVVRGGPGAILAWAGTLREALNRAFELSREGGAPTSIREPNDQTAIQAEQIWELWEHLGMVDKRPTRIAERYVAKGFTVLVAGAVGATALSGHPEIWHLQEKGHVVLYPNLAVAALSTSAVNTGKGLFGPSYYEVPLGKR
jgi:hypothetical protein